jgi:DNA ligase-1
MDELNNILRKTGDIGETAKNMINKRTNKQFTFDMFSSNGQDNNDISLHEVYDRFNQISQSNGHKSKEKKLKHIQYLLDHVNPDGIKYITRLAIEDMHIGIGMQNLLKAIAQKYEIQFKYIEKAYSLTNRIEIVSDIAEKEGESGIKSLDMQINQPIQMMLAQIDEKPIDEIINQQKESAIEWKFDGIRLQIHYDHGNVQIYSRKLDNLTESLPDVVQNIKDSIKINDTLVIEGEAVAVDKNGNPMNFQSILRRARRKNDIEKHSQDYPIKTYLYEITYLSNISLVDKPLIERHQILKETIQNTSHVEVCDQIVTDDLDTINKIYKNALDAGHEGIMIKDPYSTYTPGKRGKKWTKKKPIKDTLDLVVTSAEWGKGQRTGKFGSFTLSCYDPEQETYLSIGKVGSAFKDDVLNNLTERIKPIIESSDGTSVNIKPELIFEIAYEAIQKSPTYDSGFALRFPRLVTVREDKPLSEVDILQNIHTINQQ